MVVAPAGGGAADAAAAIEAGTGGRRELEHRLRRVIDEQHGGGPGVILAVEAPALGLRWAGGDRSRPTTRSGRRA